MKVSSLSIVLVCSLASVSSVYAGDMGPGLKDGSLWKTPIGENKVFQMLRYFKVDDSTIRIGGQEDLTAGGLQLGEVTIMFGEDKSPATMTVMMYNKGDDGAIDKAAFEAKLQKTMEAFNELTGVKAKPFRVAKKDSGLKLNAWQWEWENGAARVEASSTGKGSVTGKGATGSKGAAFQAEFIRLKLAPDTEGLERGGASDVLGRAKLKGNIKKEDRACWIEDIPMVDQGQKGYCVPATLSRLFAYYGMDGVDQHALAALCGSSGGNGTTLNGMEAALKTISTAFHVKLQKLEGDSLMKLDPKAYNKIAKKQGKSELRMSMNPGESNWDAGVLKELFAGKPAQVRKWLAPVTKSIDAGIPVVWSVMLGIVPEPGLNQANGGHMRMIVGYDLDKEEIVYSDSWGAGHELKRMPVGNAISITTARYILRPTR